MKNEIIVFKVIDAIGFTSGELLTEKQLVQRCGRETVDALIHYFFDEPAEIRSEGVELWDCGIRAIVRELSFASMRKLAGFTQQSFAEFLWIPKRTIENWEMQTACPSYLHYLIFEKLVSEGRLKTI